MVILVDVVSPYPKGMLPERDKCNTFWGTHGCDKRRGHKNMMHVCRNEKGGICSRVTEITHVADLHESVIRIPAGERYAVDKHGWVWHLYE
jgi:hypothetical protein